MATTVQKFRKRPIDVEAIQWTGDNLAELVAFTGVRGYFVPLEGDVFTAQVYDKLHDTPISVRTGDWILKGTHGEFYPCARDVFAATYTPAPET